MSTILCVFSVSWFSAAIAAFRAFKSFSFSVTMVCLSCTLALSASFTFILFWACSSSVSNNWDRMFVSCVMSSINTFCCAMLSGVGFEASKIFKSSYFLFSKSCKFEIFSIICSVELS